jgi:TrmH family RNA methyltransferase
MGKEARRLNPVLNIETFSPSSNSGPMITSIRNPKIQNVRLLQARSRERRHSQAFVVEGVRLVEEALTAGWQAQLVLYTQDINARGQKVVDGFRSQGAQIEAVSETVMSAASDTQAPQGILAVLPILSLPCPEKLDFVFIADAVRDPGNLGTMLRTAAAAGVQAVFLPPGTVDLYSPKVVRSAMGAHFRLAVHVLSWEEIRSKVKTANLRVYLAAANAGTSYTQMDFRLPLSLVIGGEASGAGSEGQQLADAYVHIPMPGQVESLNAAIAAAVLLFEVVRQRSS